MPDPILVAKAKSGISLLPQFANPLGGMLRSALKALAFQHSARTATQ